MRSLNGQRGLAPFLFLFEAVPPGAPTPIRLCVTPDALPVFARAVCGLGGRAPAGLKKDKAKKGASQNGAAASALAGPLPTAT